jgi:hypothetical protein
MNYREASRKAWIKIVLGIIISAPAVIILSSVFIKSVFYKVYLAEGSGNVLSDTYAMVVKRLMLIIYEQFPFTPQIWKITPTPDVVNLLTIRNLPFLFIYITIFIGSTFFWSGYKFKQKIRETKNYSGEEKIASTIIVEEAYLTKLRPPRREIDPKENSFWSTVRDTYILQIVIGIIVGGVLYILS